MVERREAWAGPLPPPAVLEQFNHVVEGGAERIFRAWEDETKHRQGLEKKDFRWSVFESIFGKVLAFIYVLAALALVAYCVYAKAEWLAAFLGSGFVASVVWAFVKTNRKH